MIISGSTDEGKNQSDRGYGVDDWRLFRMAAVVGFCLLLIPHAVAASGGSGTKSIGKFEWQILTARNFTTQIRLHRHILLFVTVPWSGESRSLMMEFSHKLTHNNEKLGLLKLMVVYGNRDKVLANSLGATGEITILCYHHSVSFKYQGRRKVQDILSSVSYLMLAVPGELPLNKIDNSEALEAFVASTDMSVLLLEHCEWTPTLLSLLNTNGTAQGAIKGGLLPRGFNKDTNRTLASGSLEILKDMGNEKLTCGVENAFSGSPWFGEFTLKNRTSPSVETDVTRPSVRSSCSFEEYQKLNSFFSKLITVARNFFLPPQRQRYGLVSERSLLSSLGVEHSGPWSLVIYYAGCRSCSKVLKEENDLQDALEMRNSPFMELMGDELDLGLALPIDKPSVLLFVDRLSHSLEIRERSKEALDAFKEVVVQYLSSYQIDGQNTNWRKKSPIQTHQVSTIKLEDPGVLVSSLSHKMKLKDKMSVMIINEGKHVTVDNIGSDIQSSPLHEILTYLLGQKKQKKLSSLAKEAGFQLLSDDRDIEITDTVSSQKENWFDSAEPSMDSPPESVVDTEEEHNLGSSYLAEHNEQSSHSTDFEAPIEFNEKQTTKDLASEQSTAVITNPSFFDHGLAFAKNVDSEKETFSHTDKLTEQQNDSSGFTGSFFFSDGNYQLLRSLTSESKVPRMVLIDPISEQHYIFPEVTDFSYFSISDFIKGFLNGTLLPYQRSGALLSPREALHPPFVNLDFHEKDSIPGVTTNTFSELVLGSSQSHAQIASHAWSKDVLVLFSNSWCGFCQRMEVVVREVYRASKGYANITKAGPKNKKMVIDNEDEFGSEKKQDAMLKLPVIYQIDCTLNECSGILKSMDQREIYPTLLLFPAEKKTAVPYEGDMAVTDIIKFIASHGSSSHHLVGQKGILWTKAEERDENPSSSKDILLAAAYQESSDAKDKYYEVLRKSRNWQNQVQYKQMRSHSQTSSGSKVANHNVGIGSFLVATDKLLGISPFDKARILIVRANRSTGFQGLIVNKHIKWDSLPELEHVELLKEAPLSFGGPVIDRELPLVALTRKYLRDQYIEVLQGVYFLDQLATIREIEEINTGNQSAKDYWFFLGYSGWGWSQLYSEIAEDSWSLGDGSMADLHWL
ncbi:hypothetical protein Nepgr_014341 [Nepenthes gracilis]|uniref:Thioredoxin domain-containing protein n=1 Tax=Nepenthes gracilis TaxID=150966 RepID=A0AAD3SIZ5_NEPGR|nr:hypothetical protein Nepgr_014341 [Nepenthes gracilis]